MRRHFKAEELRQYLDEREPHYLPELSGDPDHRQYDLTPAAVLIGLVNRQCGPSILLTQRTDNLRDHAGQVSFPGGRVDEEDESPEDTALREAYEEIGLDREKVQVLRSLQPYRTVTGFHVVPVVGWIEPPVGFALQPDEVAELFELPLSHLCDPINHRQRTMIRNGRERQVQVIDFKDYFIWGATAAMLLNFSRLLQDFRP